VKTSVSKRRRCGQHFLRDRKIIQRLVDLSNVGPSDTVYEIGTGTGNLTERLCARARFVTSSEIDVSLFKKAKEKLSELRNLRLENIDGFGREVKFDFLVASLPYSGSRRFIEWLACLTFTRAIVLMQQEFAEKILSAPKTSRYSAVSVIAQRCLHVRTEDSVSRVAFTPAPQVDSVILSLEPRNPARPELIRVINKFFSFKRKLASSMLATLERQHNIDLSDSFHLIHQQQRVTDLYPDELFALAAKVYDKIKG